MRSRLRCFLIALLLLGFTAAASAQGFSSLEERMSEREFKAAGLDKLSAEELSFLNDWLAQRGLSLPVGSAEAPTQAGQDLTGLSVGGDRVESRIRGSFRGWSGKTQFPLENGQVWEQSEPSVLAGANLESPQVTITKGVFGAWFLRVEGYNARVRVRRIQ
ncbi:MAG: hypothetical protein MEQ07_01020 [Aquimonas sp.]|nr:hypothetical protein [Aquimonas sp.]